MTGFSVSANMLTLSPPRPLLLAKNDQDAAPANAKALITWEPTLSLDMNGADSNCEKASWSNNGPFLNTWQRDNISFSNGTMTITLDNRDCPGSCDGKPVASGEYRTRHESYGYGYYEASMKPTSGSGLMSGSFFTFRGTYGQPSHDEIDMEFLGKDRECRTLQTNYYAAGRGNHEQIIDLDFNACQGFHNYGFKWARDSLIFYVDGKAVRRIEGGKLPSRPGKIMTNLWAGTSEVADWLGSFQYSGPRQVQLRSIKYSTLEAGEKPASADLEPAKAEEPAQPFIPDKPAPAKTAPMKPAPARTNKPAKTLSQTEPPKPVAAVQPTAAPALPAAPLKELDAVREGLVIYDYLTYRSASRQRLSKVTAENVLKQGFVPAAIDGGLSPEEKEIAVALANINHLNDTENYGTAADLLALFQSLDKGEIALPTSGPGLSAESPRKIKDALVIFDLLTYKVFSKKLLSAETQAEVGKPDLGMVPKAIKAGGGITPQLFEVVKSLGEDYLKHREASAGIEVLLKNEPVIKARLCSVAQIGCEAAPAPQTGSKPTLLFPAATIVASPEPSGLKPFIDLDELATAMARDIAGKLKKGQHLDNLDATKLHINVAAVFSDNYKGRTVNFIAGLLYDGGKTVRPFEKTYAIPTGYSKEDVESYLKYLEKAVANKPIILSRSAD